MKREELDICMNCGCGEPDKRHQPTDITKDDLQQAADGGGISLEEASSNLRSSLDQVSGSGSNPSSGAASS